MANKYNKKQFPLISTALYFLTGIAAVAIYCSLLKDKIDIIGFYSNIAFGVVSLLLIGPVLAGLHSLRKTQNALVHLRKFYFNISAETLDQKIVNLQNTIPRSPLIQDILDASTSEKSYDEKILNLTAIAYDCSEESALEESGSFLRIILEHSPALFAALGIIFTFFGLITGISTLDLGDLNNSMRSLIEGVAVAFFSSLVGVSLSFLTLTITRFHFSDVAKTTAVIRGYAGRLEQKYTSQAILLRLEQQSDTQTQNTHKLIHLATVQNTMLSALPNQIEAPLNQIINLATQQSTALSALPDQFATSLTTHLETPLSALTESITRFSADMSSSQKDMIKNLSDAINGQFSDRLNEQFTRLDHVLTTTIEWHTTTRELYEDTWQNLKSHVTAHQEQLAFEREYFHTREQADAKRATQIQESLAITQQALKNNQHMLELAEEHNQRHQNIIEHTNNIAEKFTQAAQSLQDTTKHFQKLESDLLDAIHTANTGAEQSHEKSIQLIKEIQETLTDTLKKSDAQIADRAEILRVEGERTQFMLIAHDLSQKSLGALLEHFELTKPIIDRTQDISTQLATSSESLQSVTSTLQRMDQQIAGAITQATRSSTQSVVDVQKIVEKFGNTVITAMQATENQTKESISQLHNRMSEFDRNLINLPEQFAGLVKEVTKTLENDMINIFTKFDHESAKVVNSLGGTYTHMQATIERMHATTNTMNTFFQSLEKRLTDLPEELKKLQSPPTTKITQPIEPVA